MEQYLLELGEEADPDRVERAIRLRKNDIESAVSTLQQLSEEGSKVASMVLADVLLYGWFDYPADPPRGEQLMRQAVDMGSIEAAFRLAVHCQKVGSNAEALRLLEALAERGYTPAMYRLGSHFQRGHLVARDEARARRLLDLAVRGGHILAMKRLALLSLKTGKPSNVIRGLGLYLKSIPVHFSQLRKDKLSDRLRY